MKNTNYDVDILVNGKPQKIHYYQNKYYIEGRENYEYSIKINNRSWNKILTVVSIDGLSVMDGKTASNDSGGYIIEAYQNYEIKGYRKDLNSVGAFKFSRKNNSYAKSKGNNAENNCGIIGVRIFEEKQPIITYSTNKPYFGDSNDIIWRCISGNGPDNTLSRSCGGTSNSAKPIQSYNMSMSFDFNNESQDKKDIFSLGSTWGQKVQSQVTETTFERGNLLFSQDIYYSTRQNLINMGVPILKEPKISYPQSFPKSFCEPPSGWKE